MLPADYLAAQQFTLARHIRDPEAYPPPPDIEARRLTIYCELFYNNVEGLLSGNFPVIRKLLGDTTWHTLIRAFFRDHRCETPLFPELAREFIRFVEQRAAQSEGDPPWLPQLAHYEWVELALDIAPNDEPPADPQGDLLDGIPVLSSLAWPLAYDWPVHRLSPRFLPDRSSEPSFLVVQRDAKQSVRFHEISALTFRLLQHLEASRELSGREHLQALAQEVQATDLTGFLTQGHAMLMQLQATGVLLGTRPPKS